MAPATKDLFVNGSRGQKGDDGLTGMERRAIELCHGCLVETECRKYHEDLYAKRPPYTTLVLGGRLFVGQSALRARYIRAQRAKRKARQSG